MQTLAFSIAGCMAMDVADILRKGRHGLTGLDVSFLGDRAESPPHRFTGVKLYVHRARERSRRAVRRAIALSHETLLLGFELAAARYHVHHGVRGSALTTTGGNSVDPVVGDRTRLLYLDWLRGIAVVAMVLAHVTDSWTRDR